MARFAGLHEGQEGAGDEAADGPAQGVGAETDTPSEPGNGKAELKLSFQATVTEKMSKDDAIGSGQAETRRQVLELFPHPFGAGFFFFMVSIQSGRCKLLQGNAFSAPEGKLVQNQQAP